MTRLNTSSTYTYSPADEAKAARKEAWTDALCTIAVLVIFAGIGVLLAWRG